jgi:hypothetical protein
MQLDQEVLEAEGVVWCLQKQVRGGGFRKEVPVCSAAAGAWLLASLASLW